MNPIIRKYNLDSDIISCLAGGFFTNTNPNTIVGHNTAQYGYTRTTPPVRGRTGGGRMTDRLVPGELIRDDDPVTINQSRETAEVTVENTGDRPVQVGSHYHFFEANPKLDFDRESAFGMRLNVPAGTAIRFEPGTERDVPLVAIGGEGIVHGMAGLTNGDVSDDDVKQRALERATERGFLGAER